MQQNTEIEKAKKVQVVVFKKEGTETYVLLLQTNKERGEFWQNITGGVEKDEKFIEGAKRELFEETGISSDVNQTKLVFEFHDRWNKDVSEKVFWTITNEARIKISADEHQNYKWVNVRDVNENDYKYPNNFQAFKESLKCLEN